MDKSQILATIKRLTGQNDGTAPGYQSFERATGVKKSDWYPHLWLRWGDAVVEAGCSPNKFQTRIDDGVLIEKYIGLIRELGRFPVEGEVRRKARSEPSFPHHGAFMRFGGRDKLRAAIAAHCRDNPGLEDVISLCVEHERAHELESIATRKHEAKVATGFVYLMKSGPHYKIGRTNSLGRRGSELAIKIPVPPKTVHSIETDDPIGVEAYWHRRFADKRGEGEWFALSLDDVMAFRRWKRIA